MYVLRFRIFDAFGDGQDGDADQESDDSMFIMCTMDEFRRMLRTDLPDQVTNL